MPGSDKLSTRHYSDKQEKSVCKAIGAIQHPNSGAGHWRKGDVINRAASILCECKCSMSDKSSFSIKKEWLDKNKEECYTQRVSSGCLAFNFGPDEKNYYVIDESLMRYLVEKLESEDV